METMVVVLMTSVAIRKARTNSRAVEESRPRVELKAHILAYIQTKLKF